MQPLKETPLAESASNCEHSFTTYRHSSGGLIKQGISSSSINETIKGVFDGKSEQMLLGSSTKSNEAHHQIFQEEMQPIPFFHWKDTFHYRPHI